MNTIKSLLKRIHQITDEIEQLNYNYEEELSKLSDLKEKLDTDSSPEIEAHLYQEIRNLKKLFHKKYLELIHQRKKYHKLLMKHVQSK